MSIPCTTTLSVWKIGQYETQLPVQLDTAAWPPPAARTPTSYCRRRLRRGRRRSARSPRGSKSIASSCSFLCKSPAGCAADLRWLWEQPRADLPYLGGDGQPPAAARSHQSPGQGRRIPEPHSTKNGTSKTTTSRRG